MQRRPLFAQSDIDKALQHELSIENQEANRKILSNWQIDQLVYALYKFPPLKSSWLRDTKENARHISVAGIFFNGWIHHISYFLQ